MTFLLGFALGGFVGVLLVCAVMMARDDDQWEDSL